MLKRSYQLLTIYLDRAPLMEYTPALADNILWKQMNDLGVEINLFDFPVCKRKVLGSCLLRSASFQEIKDIIKKIDIPFTLVVILDYETKAETANRLFVIRILQILEKIHETFPFVKILVSLKEENKYNGIRKTWDEILMEQESLRGNGCSFGDTSQSHSG